MLIRSHLILFFVLTMLVPVSTLAASSLKKPQPPVQVVIIADQPSNASAAIKPGDEVPLRVSAVPSTDATEIRISCTLSDGVDLVSGALEWSGPAKKGEERNLTFTVRARKGHGSVTSRISIYDGQELLYSAKVEYDLGPQPEKKPQRPIGTRKDGKGRRVDEYR